MFRLPDWVLDAETAGQFCCTDAASVIGAAGHLILPGHVLEREAAIGWPIGRS